MLQPIDIVETAVSLDRPFFIQGTTFQAVANQTTQAQNLREAILKPVQKHRSKDDGKGFDQQTFQLFNNTQLSITFQTFKNVQQILSHQNGPKIYNRETYAGGSLQSEEKQNSFKREFDSALVKLRGADLGHLRLALQNQADISDERRQVPSDIFTVVGSFLSGTTGTLDVQNAKLLSLAAGRKSRKHKSRKRKSRKHKSKKQKHTSSRKNSRR